MRYSEALRIVVFVAAGAVAGACAADEPVSLNRGPALGLSPSSVTLAPGAAQTVTVWLREDVQAQGARFRWRVADTAVARLDSVSAATTRVYLRAVAPGATALLFDVTGTPGGFEGSGSLPVRVQ